MVNAMVTSSEVNASAAYARSVLPNSLIHLVCFTEKRSLNKHEKPNTAFAHN